MTGKELWGSILQKAMEGKLVPQRKEEGTAAELLKEIRKEKAKLVKEGKLKKTKPLPVVREEEKPFDIPDSWEWVRLGEVSTYGLATQKIKSSDMQPDMWILDMEDIEKDTGRILRYGLVKEKKVQGDKTVFWKNDILYSKLRPYLKKILIAPADGICTTELVPFQMYGEIDRNYIVMWLKSPFVNQIVNADSYGVKMPRVGKSTMQNLALPFPPLAEQHRIVEKLKTLKPLVDAYGQAAEELDELNRKFPGDLKKSLLQQAMEGKLVSQRKEEGTAAELLKEIRKEKSKLVKEGKLKKTKPLPAVSEEEKPFDIPDSWEWVRLGDISINLDSERIPLSVSQRSKLEKIYDYYGASGVIDKVDNYLFDKPLLLIGEDGANLLTRSKPIAFIAKGKYWVNNHAHVLDFPVSIDKEYVMFYINSISLSAYVTGTAQPKMNQANMNTIPVPLPPSSEQHRIVKKLESLLALCDKLQPEN